MFESPAHCGSLFFQFRACHLVQLAARLATAIQARLIILTENTRQPKAGMTHRWPQGLIVHLIVRPIAVHLIVPVLKFLACFRQSCGYKLPLCRCHLLECSLQSVVHS